VKALPKADSCNHKYGKVILTAESVKEETLRAFLNNEEWINICKLFNVTP